MGRIILVDDDPLLADLIGETLLRAGHPVGGVDTGSQALRAMRGRHPDVVILDQRMPEMTGTEILRQMRTDPELAQIPVLMLTSVDGENDERIAYFEGADDYLTKPCDLDELVARVEALIARKLKRHLHR